MTITGKIEAADYIAAQWLNMRPRKLMRIIIYCLLLLTGVVYSAMIKDMVVNDDIRMLPFWLITLVIGYLFVYFGWFLPWKTKKMYMQHKELQKPFELELSAETFHVRSEEGEAHTPWTEFHKWKEGKKLFLIYRSDNLFHIIPKRSFPTAEEETALRVILQEKIGQEST